MTSIVQQMGRDISLVGGTSCDNALVGKDWQIGNQKAYKDACILMLVLTPLETDVLVAFDGAREPSVAPVLLTLADAPGVCRWFSVSPSPWRQGVVTKADPVKRIIHEIDGKPAAVVYNEWYSLGNPVWASCSSFLFRTGGLISKALEAKTDTVVAFDVTLRPLGLLVAPDAKNDSELHRLHHCLASLTVCSPWLQFSLRPRSRTTFWCAR